MLGASGFVALWQGRQDAALLQLQESLAIEREMGDEQWVAFLLMASAVALINMGQDDIARPMFEEAHAKFKEQNNIPFSIITRVHLGNSELGLGHLDKARAYHEEALAEARVINENWLISFALNNLGEVARTQGQFDLAR